MDPQPIPEHTRCLTILSPISGAVVSLQQVPHSLFNQGLFGDGVAIKPSGYQVIAPFSGVITHFPPLANQIRIKSSLGLQVQIQLGIDSHNMMGDGFKRQVSVGSVFVQGQVLAEFSLVKMKQQLVSTLCPVTILNSAKLKAIQGHYYTSIANQDKIMSAYM
jgi:PTS system glucose-specific IIA component